MEGREGRVGVHEGKGEGRVWVDGGKGEGRVYGYTKGRGSRWREGVWVHEGKGEGRVWVHVGKGVGVVCTWEEWRGWGRSMVTTVTSRQKNNLLS